MVSRELLAACRNGDPRAFEEVVRLTYRHVYTQALRIVGDRQEAEDVSQDAYLRVFKGLDGFRGEAQFETWLYRIVANAALSHLRRRRRFGELVVDPEDETSEPPAPSEFAERTVDRESLSRALQALPVSLRSVVVLKDVYGLSCQEIGDQIGVSEGAVKVRLHRARKRLKDMLFEGDVSDEV
jgi:RNA polymerase sigma-70 factor (ECF subfamily)